ncbi:MAG: pyridoxamine 5'-phosphate oxidase family protein [Paracoccaceae bacterium]|nr:pyridoxamine 5'-phosphate oxidase family protein [Paracoccaceae bacterium]
MSAAIIDDDAQRIIREFPLGIIASGGPDGPAASPKGTFLVLDPKTLAYGDIRSPGSRANLSEDARCETVFVDPFRRKGVRIRGEASIVNKCDTSFANNLQNWRDVWGDLADRIGALVLISVTRVSHITTPPYDTGATEDEMIALYKTKYAELYP